ncbi:MAG TPA: aspartate aminotransferase family protein, partial [Beutenbergiaceae bacterium]|nr:aspartate aminotransferase family protein [Beutenbergiaceae bacterium]
DVHKYGYAPKGASVVLYRDREAYHHQFFACVSWPGYPVVNPTILGSRSVTALAASWAVISHLGTEGYRDAVKRIHNATVSLTDVINQIDGMRIVGNPFGPLLALGADDSCAQPVDPFRLVDELKNHGFLAQAQPGHGILPRSAHLTLTPVSADLMDELSTALKTAADAVRGLGPAQPRMELLHSVLESGLPQEQAEIMATLEGLPVQVACPALIDLLGSIANPKPPQ